MKRSVAAGQLKPGDPFPSLRSLSRELRINPNTAQKVVTQLMHSGLLVSIPGVGTVVQKPPIPSKAESSSFLKSEIDVLVVEARRLGISDAHIKSALETALEEYPQKL